MTIAPALSPLAAPLPAPATTRPGMALAPVAPQPAGAARFVDALLRTADPLMWPIPAPSDGLDAAASGSGIPLAGMPMPAFSEETETASGSSDAPLAGLPMAALGTWPFSETNELGAGQEAETPELPEPPIAAMVPPAMLAAAAVPASTGAPVVLDSARLALQADAPMAPVAAATEPSAPIAIHPLAATSPHASRVPPPSPTAPAPTPAGTAPDAWPASTTLGPEAAAVREKSAPLPVGLREASPTAWSAPAPTNSLSTPQASAGAASPADPRSPQALVDTLGERIDWQLKRGSERAVIRLDPPMQGQLEITIRRDGAGIQVHLAASSSEVVRQLQTISDGLRQDLAGRQAGDVAVVVSHSTRDSDGRGRQSGQTPDQEQPGKALSEAENDLAPARFALHSTPY